MVRTSAFFGPWDKHNFVTLALEALGNAASRSRAAGDLTVSPTYVPDLVHACLDLLIDGEAGIWHLSQRRRHELGRAGRAAPAPAAGIDPAGWKNAAPHRSAWPRRARPTAP